MKNKTTTTDIVDMLLTIFEDTLPEDEYLEIVERVEKMEQDITLTNLKNEYPDKNFERVGTSNTYIRRNKTDEDKCMETDLDGGIK